jgi:hypothetical protein
MIRIIGAMRTRTIGVATITKITVSIISVPVLVGNAVAVQDSGLSSSEAEASLYADMVLLVFVLLVS